MPHFRSPKLKKAQPSHELIQWLLCVGAPWKLHVKDWLEILWVHWKLRLNYVADVIQPFYQYMQQWDVLHAMLIYEDLDMR